MWIFGGWIFCRVEGFIFGTSLRSIGKAKTEVFRFDFARGQYGDILEGH